MLRGNRDRVSIEGAVSGAMRSPAASDSGARVALMYAITAAGMQITRANSHSARLRFGVAGVWTEFD